MKKIGKLKTLKSDEISLKSHASIGFECLDRELFEPDRCYDILAETGVKYARVQTGWNRCELKKGVYTFEWLDDIVDNLLNRGIQPWFNVGYGNPVYMENATNPTAVGCVPLYYGEETLKAWENYIEALAKHFSGRISHYEIWNEPDSGWFWVPEGPNGAEYARFVDLTGDIIRKNDKNAKIGACMSGISAPSHYCLPGIPGDFFRLFVQNIKKLDFFCYHRYTLRPDVDIAKDVAFIRKGFALNGFDNVEIWGGECGYGSYIPDGHSLSPIGHGSEHQQAVALLRYFLTDAAVGARLTSFYTVADYTKKIYETAVGKTEMALFGIIDDNEYKPKMACKALSYISNIMSCDMTVADRYATVVSHIKPYINMPMQPFFASFNRNGKPCYGYYYPQYLEDEAGLYDHDFHIHLQNMYEEDKMVDPVAVDSLTGDVYEPVSISNSKYVTILRGMPVAEYPIFIIERSEIEIE